MFLPTTWLEEEAAFGAGARRLVVRRTGGHTVDSSSAVLASEGVVFAGDLVQARRRARKALVGILLRSPVRGLVTPRPHNHAD